MDMDPTSPPQNPLAIRTAKQQTQQIQQAPSSSSSQQHHPEYPIRIPPDKQTRALELYHNFKLEEMLAQNSTAGTLDGYHLGVPGASTSRSVTSQGSSKRRGAPSTSASQCEGMTDYSSVVSFDQSPSSAKAKEFLSYDGKKVKTRTRRKLTPTARAKAALVRYLGSCQPCRSRRVPCPLEHHDIECLEALRASMPQDTPPEPQRSPFSAASSSSERTARSITGQEAPSSSWNDDALIGIGTQLSEIKPDFDTTLDILSTGPAGNYGNTQTETPAPATLNFLSPNLPIADPNPYATFQHGALFLIGCLRGELFHCEHLQLCQQRFLTANALQDHFEAAHFAFTRIDPKHRYICSRCNFVTPHVHEPCSCGTYDFMELWICGHFIKTPKYQRQAPDGTDFQGYRPGPNYFEPASYAGPNTNGPWDPTLNGGNFGGGGNDQGQFYQGGNSYGRTGNQGHGWNASNGSGSGSTQFQERFFGAWQMAWDSEFSLQIWCAKAQQKGRHLKFLILLFLLLLAITFGYTHDWIITKARMAIPRATAGVRPHLPVIGFVILMASIAVPLLINHLAVQRVQRARSVSVTIILDQLAKKHADDILRDLDVLCTLLHTLIYRFNADGLDLNLFCVVTLACDRKGGTPHDVMIMPATKHASQPPLRLLESHDRCS